MVSAKLKWRVFTDCRFNGFLSPFSRETSDEFSTLLLIRTLRPLDEVIPPSLILYLSLLDDLRLYLAWRLISGGSDEALDFSPEATRTRSVCILCNLQRVIFHNSV